MTIASIPERRFIEELVEAFPGLRAVYDAHVVEECGDILPFVLFWNFTEVIVRSYVSPADDDLDWRGILAALEDRLDDSPDKGVSDLIGTSFLEGLPGPGQPGHEIISELGPRLTEMFRGLRPNG